MASPLSPGTWDPGPVHPGVRFGVSVVVGGFASGPLTPVPALAAAAHPARTAPSSAMVTRPRSPAERPAGRTAIGPKVQRPLEPVTASPARLLAAGQVVVSDPASPPIPGSAAPPPDAPRLASTHLRIARPSRDLAKAEAFWVGGLGLTVLHRAGPDAEGGHALLMAVWPRAAWHLELVGDRPARPRPPLPRKTCSSSTSAPPPMTR
jgi:hypothetical protein